MAATYTGCGCTLTGYGHKTGCGFAAAPVCPDHGVALTWQTGLVAPGWVCRICLEPTCDDCEKAWTLCSCEVDAEDTRGRCTCASAGSAPGPHHAYYCDYATEEF